MSSWQYNTSDGWKTYPVETCILLDASSVGSVIVLEHEFGNFQIKKLSEDNGEQYNPETRRRRKVRRMSGSFRRRYRDIWQFQNDRGGWTDCESHLCNELDDLAIGGTTQRQVGSHIYEFTRHDATTIWQKNIRTDTRRLVRKRANSREFSKRDRHSSPPPRAEPRYEPIDDLDPNLIHAGDVWYFHENRMGKSRQTWEKMYLVATKLGTDILVTIWRDRTKQDEYKNFRLTCEGEGSGVYVETSPKHADMARYGFEVGLRSDRIYTFSVDSQEECHLWVTSIKSALNFLSPSTTPGKSGYERYSFDSSSERSSVPSSIADDAKVETRRPARRNPVSDDEDMYGRGIPTRRGPGSSSGNLRSHGRNESRSRSRGGVTKKADLRAIAKIGQIKNELKTKIDVVQEEEKKVEEYVDQIRRRIGLEFEEMKNEIQNVETILMSALSGVERDEVNDVLELRKRLESRKRTIGDDVQKCRDLQSRQNEENMLDLSDMIEQIVNDRLEICRETRRNFRMPSSDRYERAFEIGRVSEESLTGVERRILSLSDANHSQRRPVNPTGNPFDAF